MLALLAVTRGLEVGKEYTMVRCKMIASIFLIVLTCAFAQQTGSKRPEFAVGSIRPSNSEGRPEVGNFNGRGYGKNATLKMMMATAYQVPAFQISGGPKWVDSDRFDIEARAEDPKTDYIQLRLMMQSLLEDRFRLKLHRETRQSAVYLLVTTKGGPKMTPSTDQATPDATGPSSSPADSPPRGGALMGRGMLMTNAATMSVLAKLLTSELGRPVLDQTNLKSRFDIRLRWTPDAQAAPGPDGTDSDATGTDLPGLFTALREQLGIEVKSGRGPVEFLVIDSAEKPSPN
jgi:uncharacterized protein (TIGR03435 family)